LINTGVKFGILSRAGASYSFDGQKLGVGIEASKAYLRENPNVAKVIVKKLMEPGARARQVEAETDLADEA